MQAPGRPYGHGGCRAPGRGEPLPAVDKRLATPGQRAEYYDGAQMLLTPANEPHGRVHSGLTYVIHAHTGAQYLSAVDMLTRTDEGSDVAPDASIYPAARDAKTGGRQLEVLAFEVTSEQRLSVPTKRARKLVARGVRQVFCILVKEQRVLGWSREDDDWRPLPADHIIEDESLARALPIAALLDAVSADDAVIRALDAKNNAVLAQIRRASRAEGHQEGHQEGETSGRTSALLAVLTARNIEVTPSQRTHITSCRDMAQLDRWLSQVATISSTEALLSPTVAPTRLTS